jgi:hypothetical protein
VLLIIVLVLAGVYFMLKREALRYQALAQASDMAEV